MAVQAYTQRTPDQQEPPVLSPVWLSVPSALRAAPLPVVAFYCPGIGATEWDQRTGGLAFGNFWGLDQPLKVAHRGVEGSFMNSEAAYQSLKWWLSTLSALNNRREMR